MNRPSSALWQSAIVAAAGVLLGSATLIYPFGRDQAEYAYTASLALDGKAVYRDVFCVKPPMTHYVHEAALAVFGHSMLSIRLLDVIWQTSTAIVILLLGRKLWSDRPAGLIAALLYEFMYFGEDFWTAAQTDGFLALPSALAVLAFVHAADTGGASARRPARTIATSAFGGAAIGVATLFKYPIGLLLPMLCPILIWRQRGRGTASAAAMIVGFGAVIGAQAAWLVRQGALTPMLWIARKFVPAYNAAGADVSWSSDLFITLLTWSVASLLLAIGVLAVAAREKRAGLQAPIIAWWLTGLIHLWIQNKFYPYHALPLLAPTYVLVAVLAAFLQTALRRAGAGAASLGVIWAGVITAAFWQSGHYPVRWYAFWKTLRGEISLNLAYGYFDRGDYSVAAGMQTAGWVRHNTKPDERVFVWGFEPAVYFLSQRQCATRFIYAFPLFGRYDWPALRSEFLAALRADPPALFIVVSHDEMVMVTGVNDDSRDALRRWPELRDFVAANYERVREIEDFEILQRIDRATPADRDAGRKE
ncbi:MAG: glycosyltransferase family 39 protein [Phycisphaerae bacterium]